MVDLREALGGPISTPVLASDGGTGDRVNPSCSARLVQPFLRMVTARRVDRDLVPREFWSVDGDGRVPVAAAHGMLQRGVECLRDVELGIKLGNSMCFGEGWPFDYAVRSAATVRDSVDV